MEYIKLIDINGEVFFWDTKSYFRSLSDGIIPVHNQSKLVYVSKEEMLEYKREKELEEWNFGWDKC